MTMNYDTDIMLPEIATLIANVAEQLRNKQMDNTQSLFLENFPIEHLPVLNSVIITCYNVGVYTKADPLFGGAGVRIFPIGALKKQANVKTEVIEKRKYKDWTATRNGLDAWKERIGNWFGTPLDEMAFYWNKTEKQVEVLFAEEQTEIKDDWFAIAPQTAFTYMCEQGKHYRNGTSEPTPTDDTELTNWNVWVGFKQVVWNYNVTEDVVNEFHCHADADDAMAAKGIKYTFEDAPLIAWLAYHSAIAFKQKAPPEQTYDLDDL